MEFKVPTRRALPLRSPLSASHRGRRASPRHISPRTRSALWWSHSLTCGRCGGVGGQMSGLTVAQHLWLPHALSPFLPFSLALLPSPSPLPPPPPPASFLNSHLFLQILCRLSPLTLSFVTSCPLWVCGPGPEDTGPFCLPAPDRPDCDGEGPPPLGSSPGPACRMTTWAGRV